MIKLIIEVYQLQGIIGYSYIPLDVTTKNIDLRGKRIVYTLYTLATLQCWVIMKKTSWPNITFTSLLCLSGCVSYSDLPTRDWQ